MGEDASQFVVGLDILQEPFSDVDEAAGKAEGVDLRLLVRLLLLDEAQVVLHFRATGVGTDGLRHRLQLGQCLLVVDAVVLLVNLRSGLLADLCLVLRVKGRLGGSPRRRFSSKHSGAGPEDQAGPEVT